jgi:hypothetical protein
MSQITEKTIAGYVVKPWTLGTFEKLAPSIESIIATLSKKGVTFDNMERELPKFVLTILPEVSQLLGVTLDKSVEETKALEMDVVISLLLTVINQNVKSIINAFSPLRVLVTDVLNTK